MKYKLIYLFAAVLTATCCGETFTLTNPRSDEVFGPFSVTNQAEVLVAGQTYVLELQQTPVELLTEKLNRIVIPSIEFRCAALQDAVNFLVESSIAADPDGVGVNMILKPPTQQKQAAQPEDPFSGNWAFPSFDTPTITLNLRQVPLLEAVSIVAKVAGYEYHIDEHGVVVLSRKDSD